jgi:gluconokinase
VRARDVVIGVDIGTTSVKAVVFGLDASAHGEGHHGFELRSPAPGREELDPAAVVDGTIAAIREAADAARAADLRVAGIALSCAMHSLLALDARGEPITQALTWADSRASEQARRLRVGPRGLALHRRTGTPVHPMSPLLKLRWFHDREPETFERAATWVGVKELVLRRLTGELVVDHGIASATGLFNLGDADWDGEALAYAGISPEQLARLVPTTEVLQLDTGGADATGLPSGTPVVAGAADGPLANLGLGAIEHGTVACSIGTSGALRVASDRPRVDERGRVFCYVLTPDRWVLGGAINNGGIVLDWLGSALAPDIGRDPAALLALAEEAVPGSGGLLFLPYLLGERAPRWRTGARGVFVGLTREHRREHLLRAAVEGVCLQLALVLEALGEAGIDVQRIRATGGFSRSALWRRILASAFGRPIGFAASPEGSALGAALLGMTALGMLDSLDRAAELVQVTETQQPDRRATEIYAQLLPIFDQAFESLAGAFDALAAIEGMAPVSRPDAS